MYVHILQRMEINLLFQITLFKANIVPIANKPNRSRCTSLKICISTKYDYSVSNVRSLC